MLQQQLSLGSKFLFILSSFFLLVPPQYNRYYYCYKTAESGEPPIPSIEGQDPLLTGPFAYRQSPFFNRISQNGYILICRRTSSQRRSYIAMLSLPFSL